MAAMLDCGWLLNKVPEEFKTRELCLAALESDSEAIAHVPHECLTGELCLRAVDDWCGAMAFVPDEFINDELYFRAIGKRDQDFSFFF